MDDKKAGQQVCQEHYNLGYVAGYAAARKAMRCKSCKHFSTDDVFWECDKGVTVNQLFFDCSIFGCILHEGK